MFALNAIQKDFIGMADTSTWLQICVFRLAASEDRWWNIDFIDTTAGIASAAIKSIHAKSGLARA
jgi:hypothetical protein